MKIEKLELDLVFDFDAILWLDSEHGMNIIDGGLTEEEAAQPKTYLTLLQAGLMHTKADITPEEARAQTKGIPANRVIKAVIAAVKEAISGETQKTQNADSETASASE